MNFTYIDQKILLSLSRNWLVVNKLLMSIVSTMAIVHLEICTLRTSENNWKRYWEKAYVSDSVQIA